MNPAPIILVVDDDTIIRSVLTRALSNEGYVVVQATDGEDGVAAFKGCQPDLVLLDAMMPNLDGFATCALLKSLPGGDRTPILIITGLQDRESVDKAFEAGATDFITKPVHMPVLRQRVRRNIQVRQAEDALRDSERRLDLALRGANLGLWDWGITAKTMVVNDRWAEILGYSLAEIDVSVYTWFDFLHPDDVAPTRNAITELLAGEQDQYEAEFRMRTKSGDYRWILARGRVVERDENGNPARAAGTHLDITERRQAEQSLRDSEEHFRQMAASIPDYIYLVEMFPDGSYVNRYNSPNLEKLTGFTVEEVAPDWSFWPNRLIHPEDRDLAQEKFTGLLVRPNYEAEYRLIRRDGSMIWVRDSARVNGAGSSRLIYGVVSDITERKRSEEMLRASQKLVGLGTLAAGVAHEINSPLQVITGVSQGLLKRAEENRLDPDFLVNKLDVIHRNGWRCAEIIRSLKTYAHASSTTLEANDLNQIVGDTLLLIEHQLSSWANIHVDTDLQPNLPALMCDRNQMAQILINLLTNARDAMPQGGQISITTAYNSAAQEFSLRVADTGLGMIEAVRAKIFDPFFTTKALDQGSGLGLSIIAGIVKAHGGQIEADSQPGHGSVFKLTFPAVSHCPEIPANGVGRYDDVQTSMAALTYIENPL